MNSSDRSRDLNWIDRIRGFNWRPVGLLLLVAVVLVAIWTTQRGKTTAFPAPLLQAVGLLLTGLVFVLALAQSRLSRTADAAAENARHSEEVVIDSYLEHPEAVTTMDLWSVPGP